MRPFAYLRKKLSKTSKSEASSSEEAARLEEFELELLAHNTGFSKDNIIAWYKKFQSDYPDGHINKNEFIFTFKSLYTFGQADKVANFAFNLFDKNGDQKISFQEFVISTAFMNYNNMPEYRRKSLEMAFQIFDTDNNQKIDKKEVQVLLEAVYSMQNVSASQAKQKVRELFEKYDLDRSDSLDKKEFIDALCQENVFDVLLDQ